MALPKINGPITFRPNPDSDGRISRDYWEKCKSKKKYGKSDLDLTGWVLPDQEKDAQGETAASASYLRKRILFKYLKLLFFVSFFWLFGQVIAYPIFDLLMRLWPGKDESIILLCHLIYSFGTPIFITMWVFFRNRQRLGPNHGFDFDCRPGSV